MLIDDTGGVARGMPVSQRGYIRVITDMLRSERGECHVTCCYAVPQLLLITSCRCFLMRVYAAAAAAFALYSAIFRYALSYAILAGTHTLTTSPRHDADAATRHRLDAELLPLRVSPLVAFAVVNSNIMPPLRQGIYYR